MFIIPKLNYFLIAISSHVMTDDHCRIVEARCKLVMWDICTIVLVCRPSWKDGKPPEKIVKPRYDGLNSYKKEFY